MTSSCSGAVAQRLNELVANEGEARAVQFTFSNQTLSALEYETLVGKGSIPTRDCLHDWYNGLVWLLFPQSRRMINQLHLSEALDARSGNGRNPRRDALTLFDESGALLMTKDDEVELALKNHDWHSLFVKQREKWGPEARLLLFGHGLLESLHQPYKGLCAKVLRFSLCPSSFDAGELSLDELLAERLAGLASTRELMPLPVMGVPGWCAANEVAEFYADSAVFRPKPTSKSA